MIKEYYIKYKYITLLSMCEEKSSTYKNIQCQKGCCLFRILSYDHNANIPYITCKEHIKKAGCFIYDLVKRRVLLVQSRGQLWGPPKGSIQDDESPLECAIREVKEETGLTVSINDFIGSTVVNSKALYYFINIDSSDVHLFPQELYGNDANGIGWVQIDCLIELITNQMMHVNKHCKLLIEKVFKTEIPSTGRVSNVKKCLLHTLAQSETK